MKQKKTEQKGLTAEEKRLMEQLRKHPAIMERVKSIMEIAGSKEGPLKSADEVEELLVQEMRELGNASMTEWALQAQERVARELKEKDPTIRSRKKKR
jgi:hypothetical protein